MAEGLFNRIAPEGWHASSCGVIAGPSDGFTFTVMEEAGGNGSGRVLRESTHGEDGSGAERGRDSALPREDPEGGVKPAYEL